MGIHHLKYATRAMGNLKVASGVLALLAVALLVVGGAGFSQVSAERGVNIAVVNDSSAFVGYETSGKTVYAGQQTTLVTITNRLDQDIQIQELSTEPTVFDVEDGYQDAIAPGESHAVIATPNCTEKQTVSVIVDVAVVGEGIRAELFGDTPYREFSVTCYPWGVYFTGTGNAFVNTDETEERVRIWVRDDDVHQYSFADHPDNFTSISTHEPLQPSVIPDEGTEIVAVEIVGGATYLHPDFNLTDSTFDSPTDGGRGEIVTETELTG